MKRIVTIVLAAIILTACGTKEKEMEELKIEQIGLENLCITVIYDNTAYFEELTADWGFACVIDGAGKKILFDTGAKGNILMANIDSMRLDPGKVDVVVLSHAHWDHTGGLEAFLVRNSEVSVYVLKSFPDEVKKLVTNAGANLVEVSGPQTICKGVYTTGSMGNAIKEQSLIISTDKGAVVITGCAHPGIVEIAEKTREMTDQPPLLVMGGFHLRGYSENDVKAIIEGFKGLDVNYVGPCHCTGEEQIGVFRQAYSERCLDIGVGREITGVDFVFTH